MYDDDDDDDIAEGEVEEDYVEDDDYWIRFREKLQEIMVFTN